MFFEAKKLREYLSNLPGALRKIHLQILQVIEKLKVIQDKVRVMNNPIEESKAFPLIMTYSTPAIIALLISDIYNIVNRMFIGNYVGDLGLSALSICFLVTFIMIGIGLLASAGGGTVFALKLGERDMEEANQAFGNAFSYVFLLELIITIVLF